MVSHPFDRELEIQISWSFQGLLLKDVYRFNIKDLSSEICSIRSLVIQSLLHPVVPPSDVSSWDGFCIPENDGC